MSQLASIHESADALTAYVPKQEHVRNRLRSIYDELRGAPAWPWQQALVDLHRKQTLPYLYGLLSDEDEVSSWSARIDAEITRLDATSIPF